MWLITAVGSAFLLGMAGVIVGIGSAWDNALFMKALERLSLPQWATFLCMLAGLVAIRAQIWPLTFSAYICYNSVRKTFIEASG